jgi:hypothetical protein
MDNQNNVELDNKTAPKPNSISEECLAELTLTATAKAKGNTSTKALVIAWYGLGYTPQWFISPEGANKAESKASKKDFNNLKLAIISGFPKSAQEMLAVNVNALPNSILYPKAPFLKKCKAHRKHWQQQIGAVMSDVKSALATLCKDNPQEFEGKDYGSKGAGNAKTNKKDVVLKLLNKLVKKDIEALVSLKEKQDLDACNFKKSQFTSYIHKAIAELNKMAIQK